MITYDPDTKTIKVTESISWEHVVEPIWDNIFEDVQANKDEYLDEFNDLMDTINNELLPTELMTFIADALRSSENFYDSIDLSDEYLENAIHRFLEWEYDIDL